MMKNVSLGPSFFPFFSLDRARAFIRKKGDIIYASNTVNCRQERVNIRETSSIAKISGAKVCVEEPQPWHSSKAQGC
jgi:hypothetical protein